MPGLFKIIEDPEFLLDELEGLEIFWWNRPRFGRKVFASDWRFSFDLEANCAAYFHFDSYIQSPVNMQGTAVIEDGASLVLADYSGTGKISGVEILSYDCFAAERMFEEDDTHWINKGTIPPINNELSGRALSIALKAKAIQS
jgi:hypothetical protein